MGFCYTTEQMKFLELSDRVRAARLKKTFLGLGESPLLISLFLGSVLFALQLHFFRPYYLVNDDIFKIFMAKGIGTNRVPSPFFGYSNVLLGYFFKQWFSWFPSFPWYGSFLCGVQFLSFVSVLWLIRSRPGREFHTFLFIASCLSVHFIFFTFLQFTMTASIAAQAAILLIFFFPDDGGRGRGRHLAVSLAGLLLLLASLIRMESLLLVLLATIPLLVWRPGKAAPGSSRGSVRELGWLFVFLISCAALFHFAWFLTKPEWREYIRFDNYRVQLQDYRITSYSPATKPFFDSVGWSENDLWLFKNWFYPDEKKFSRSKLETLSSFFPRVGSEGKIATYHSLRELLGSFWNQRFLVFFLAIVLFCRGKPLLFLLVQSAWVGALFVFLIYFYRAPDRVTLPIFLFLVNLAVLFSERDQPGVKTAGAARPWLRGLLFAPLLTVIVFSFPVLRDYHRQNLERRKSEEQAGACLKAIKPRPDQLYVMWDFPWELLGAFDDFEWLRPMRIFEANFSQRCPSAMETLREFGIADLPRDLVDNPRVFLNCNQEEGVRYHAYMEENHGMDIRAETVFECGPTRIYSIHSRKGR